MSIHYCSFSFMRCNEPNYFLIRKKKTFFITSEPIQLSPTEQPNTFSKSKSFFWFLFYSLKIQRLDLWKSRVTSKPSYTLLLLPYYNSLLLITNQFLAEFNFIAKPLNSPMSVRLFFLFLFLNRSFFCLFETLIVHFGGGGGNADIRVQWKCPGGDGWKELLRHS